MKLVAKWFWLRVLIAQKTDLPLAQTHHDRHISYIFFGHLLFQEKEHKRTNDRKGILKNGANDRYSFFEFEELIGSFQSRI